MTVLKESVKNFLFILENARRLQLPVIFPTDTIYGIGAPISSVKANKKIFEIKKRDARIPFPILAGSWNMAATIAMTEKLSEEKLLFIESKKGLPVTYILEAKKNLDNIYVKNGTVAVRIPRHEKLAEAIRLFGEPITATSVNISKEPPAENFENAFNGFKNSVELFINGKPPGQASSEIYDISKENIVKIR